MVETKWMRMDFVPVEKEPLHRERYCDAVIRIVDAKIPANTSCLWHQHIKYGVYICMSDVLAIEQPIGQSPRALEKHHKQVFCRNHWEDRLIHQVTAKDNDIYILEIELQNATIRLPNTLLQHLAHPAMTFLEEDEHCRVYRMRIESTDSIQFVLSTKTVLVVLDPCKLQMKHSTESPRVILAPDSLQRIHSDEMWPGDVFIMQSGEFALYLDRELDEDHVVELILLEIF
ncbi:hypothetical protein ABG067_007059 [Albugo candida]